MKKMGFFLFILLFTAIFSPLRAMNLLNVALDIRINPEIHSLDGKATLEIIAEENERIGFFLNKSLAVTSLKDSWGKQIDFENPNGILTFSAPESGKNVILVSYNGSFPDGGGEETISQEQVFFGDNGNWHPAVPFETFSYGLKFESSLKRLLISNKWKKVSTNTFLNFFREEAVNPKDFDSLVSSWMQSTELFPNVPVPRF